MYLPEFIFKLMLLCGFILYTDGSRKHGDDYSEDEKLLLRFFKCKNEMKWIWSVRPFCRVLCPRPSSTTVIHSVRIQQREIVLEAPGCVKMEVETLLCSCKKNRQTPFMMSLGQFTKQDEYVSGPHGEIYKLEKADGICDEFKTLVISDRIDTTLNTSLPPVPKLLGVARIFESRLAAQIEDRQRAARSKERLKSASETFEDSDEDNSGDSNQNHVGEMGNPLMTFRITIQ